MVGDGEEVRYPSAPSAARTSPSRPDRGLLRRPEMVRRQRRQPQCRPQQDRDRRRARRAAAWPQLWRWWRETAARWRSASSSSSTPCWTTATSPPPATTSSTRRRGTGRPTSSDGAHCWASPPGSADVSPYASPSRADDLSNLPPAFIIVGELDLFVDEDIDYAQRLTQAGVPVELHVFPGAFHGSDMMVPTSENSQRWATIQRDALHQALHS